MGRAMVYLLLQTSLLPVSWLRHNTCLHLHHYTPGKFRGGTAVMLLGQEKEMSPQTDTTCPAATGDVSGNTLCHNDTHHTHTNTHTQPLCHSWCSSTLWLGQWHGDSPGPLRPAETSQISFPPLSLEKKREDVAVLSFNGLRLPVISQRGGGGSSLRTPSTRKYLGDGNHIHLVLTSHWAHNCMR